MKRAFITPVDWGIDDYRVENWKVGKYLKDTVSKGVVVTLKLPILRKEDLQELVSDHGVDSWLIKIRRKNTYRNEVLGSVYIPLTTPDRKRASSGQIRLASFHIYYHAAAASTRFENLNCPAFNHTKSIKDIKTQENTAVSFTKLSLTASEEEILNSKVEAFSYGNIIFSGGMSLLGDYQFEIAFYNHFNKTKKSNFLAYSDSLNVLSESESNIPGCENATIPEMDNEEKNFKSFKFGQ